MRTIALVLAVAAASWLLGAAWSSRAATPREIRCALTTVELSALVARTGDGVLHPIGDRDQDPIFVRSERCERWELR